MSETEDVKKVFKERPTVPRAWSPSPEREGPLNEPPQVIVVHADNELERPSLAEEAPEIASRHPSRTVAQSGQKKDTRGSTGSHQSRSSRDHTHRDPNASSPRSRLSASTEQLPASVEKPEKEKGKKHKNMLKKLKFWKNAKSDEGVERPSGTPSSARTPATSTTTAGYLAAPHGHHPVQRSVSSGRLSSRSSRPRSAETVSLSGVSARAQKRKAHRGPKSPSGFMESLRGRPKADPTLDDDQRSSPTLSVRTVSTVTGKPLKPVNDKGRKMKQSKKQEDAAGPSEQKSEKTPLIMSTSGKFQVRGEKGVQKGWWARFNDPPTRTRRSKPLVALALVGCFIMGALYCSTVTMYQHQYHSFQCEDNCSAVKSEKLERKNNNSAHGQLTGKAKEESMKKIIDKKNETDTKKSQNEKGNARHRREVRKDEKEDEQKRKESVNQDEREKETDKDTGMEKGVRGKGKVDGKGSSKNESSLYGKDPGETKKNEDVTRKYEGAEGKNESTIEKGRQNANHSIGSPVKGIDDQRTAPKNRMNSTRNRHDEDDRQVSHGKSCNQNACHSQLTPIQWGFINHMAPAIVAILAPVIGALVEFAPRFFVVLGLFLLGAAYVGYGCIYLITSANAFMRISLFLRFIQAFGTSAFAVAIFAILATECPSNMAMVTSMALASVISGFTLGPPIYAGFFEVSRNYDIGGLILGGLAVGLSIISCPCIKTVNNRPVEKWLGRSPSMFSSVFLWLLALTTIVSGLSTTFFACRLFKTVTEVTQEVLYVTLVIAGFVLLLLITFFIFGSLMIVRKISAWSFVVFGLGLTAAGYFLAGPVPLFEFKVRLWSISTSAGLLAIGFGMSSAPLYSGLLDAANKAGRPESLKLNAHVAGLFVSCLFVGVFLASVLADYAIPQLGWRWTATVIACVNSFMILVATVYKGWKVFIRRKRNFDDDYLAGAYVPPLVSYGSIDSHGINSPIGEQKQLI